MRLWKIDSGKAQRIFSDSEVSAALETRKKKSLEDGKSFVVIQEGFSSAEEFDYAKKNSKVDAICLGEELLVSGSTNLDSALKYFRR